MERSHVPRSGNVCPQSPWNATQIAKGDVPVFKTFFESILAFSYELKIKGKKTNENLKSKKIPLENNFLKHNNHFNLILFSIKYFIHNVSRIQLSPSQSRFHSMFQNPFPVPNQMSFHVTLRTIMYHNLHTFKLEHYYMFLKRNSQNSRVSLQGQTYRRGNS